MKSPFVSRKTYEILQSNCKILNQQRMKVEAENKKLQRKIKELENEIKRITVGITVGEVETTNVKKTRTRKTTKKEAK